MPFCSYSRNSQTWNLPCLCLKLSFTRWNILKLASLFLRMLQTLLHYLFGCVSFCWENQGDEIRPFVHDWLFLQDAQKVFSNFAKLCLSVNLSITVLLPYNVLEQARTGSWEPTGSSFSLFFCVLKPSTFPHLWMCSCLFCISLLFCHDNPPFLFWIQLTVFLSVCLLPS